MNNRLKIIKGKNFDILEFRQGKYVKIVNGQIIGRASKYDVEEIRIQNIVGELDAGLIEVTLALSAVSALLTSENNVLPIRLLGAGGFFFSSIAGGILYFYYLRLKFPAISLLMKEKSSLAIIPYYFSLFMQPFRKSFNGLRMEVEFAYLTILGAFAIVWAALVVWILESFLP